MTAAPTPPLTGAARAKAIKRVLWAILFANWAVAAAKVVWGVWIDSTSMQADGLHSFIDGGSNVIGLVAMHFAAAPADDEHPYGHQKFEALASLAIGVMIGMGVLELGRMAFHSLSGQVRPTPTPAAFAVMIGTLLVNTVVTRLEARAGKRLGSGLLLADAKHTLSDVFVTLAVLASLALTALGLERVDGIVAVGVLGFVAFTGFQIIRQSVSFLSDTVQLAPEDVQKTCAGVPDVLAIRDVRSRGVEAAVYVDLKVDVAPNLPIARAHEAADAVERAIRARYPQVVDVVVHVEPAGPLSPAAPSAAPAPAAPASE